MTEIMKDGFRSGYCSVIGRPNVGKSTLLNALLGQKLSIVSDKPQTTRHQIELIYTDEKMQLIFVDTPGMQSPKNELGELMLHYSAEAMEDMDLLLFMVDTSPKPGKQDQKILDMLGQLENTKMIALINKIDQAQPEDVQALEDLYQEMGLFEAVIAISAKEEKHLDELLALCYELLPEGPLYYPEDMVTNRPTRFVVSELIREQCLHELRDEIPHGIFVEVNAMTWREDKDLVDIEATIYVEQNSHKGMVIGKKGAMLKKIGSQARQEIEKLVDSQVYLELWVQVAKNWRKKKDQLTNFGYDVKR